MSQMPTSQPPVGLLGKYLSLVKFSHTIFALPFALIGLSYAFKQTAGFDFYKLIYVAFCMVTARNAAMGFNRYIDRRFDALNQRTAVREIPSGALLPQQALRFVIVNSALFVFFAFKINALCFYLSPVALAVVLGYSYTKRFTALCHIVLGVGLGLAPVGAFLAVTEFFELPIVLLGFVVLTWVSGFDIIYAMQDDDFDRQHHLNSIPALLGRGRALAVSTALHVISAGLLFVFGWMKGGGVFFWAGYALFAGMLVYQHLLVKPNDLSRVNLAFFTANGIASAAFGVLVILDIIFAVKIG